MRYRLSKRNNPRGFLSSRSYVCPLLKAPGFLAAGPDIRCADHTFGPGIETQLCTYAAPLRCEPVESVQIVTNPPKSQPAGLSRVLCTQRFARPVARRVGEGKHKRPPPLCRDQRPNSRFFAAGNSSSVGSPFCATRHESEIPRRTHRGHDFNYRQTIRIGSVAVHPMLARPPTRHSLAQIHSHHSNMSRPYDSGGVEENRLLLVVNHHPGSGAE